MPPLEQPNSIGRTHQAALVFVPVPLSTSTLTSDRLACRNCPTQSSSPSDGSFANVEQTLCQPRGPFELNATLEILRFSRVSIEGILEGLSVTRNLWCSVVFFFHSGSGRTDQHETSTLSSFVDANLFCSPNHIRGQRTSQVHPWFR